jgi:hypothetical protein
VAALLARVHVAQPADAPWRSWCLPLLVRACAASAPPAEERVWRYALGAARRLSPLAAAEIARRAVEAQPWSSALAGMAECKAVDGI